MPARVTAPESNRNEEDLASREFTCNIFPTRTRNCSTGWSAREQGDPSAKAARENSWTAFVRVQFLKDHNGYAKGQTRRVDPRSAESLPLKAKVVKRADEPDPAPEDPEVP